MAEKIIVDTGAFQDSHKNLGGIIATIGTLKTEMNSTLNQLRSEWEGKTADLFFEENQKMVEDLVEVIDGLVHLQSRVLTAETSFVDMDNLLATEIEKA